MKSLAWKMSENEYKECEKCGKKVKNLTDGLCDKCYIEKNEGPCFCYNKLDRFE